MSVSRFVPGRLLVALALLSCAACSGPDAGRPVPWTLEDERALVERREDPAQWDMERLEEQDREVARSGAGRPLAFGAFPVPPYDTAGEGSYGGGGNFLTMTPWRDRLLLGQAFFSGPNPWNAPEIGDADEYVLVHVVVPMEEAPSAENITIGTRFISRNHPHLTMQGWFGPNATDVEFVAFQAANGEAWALVNLRLFDLRAGRCILVAPQPDGTLRTMQVDAPRLRSDELPAYHASLLEDPAIEAFFATSIPAGD